YMILEIILNFTQIALIAHIHLRDVYLTSAFTSTRLNVARWGTAVQSTTYYTYFYGLHAQKAVDGSSSYCSRTNTQSDPWWRLDLKNMYTVNRVTITNRICQTVNCEIWINGAVIRIGNDSSNVLGNPVCATVSSIPAGATNSFSCSGMKGRYVTVNIPGTSKTVTFCEVGVYVIFPGNSELRNNLV
uniref:Fucolectin tachylectin-4 pentraxin-1 domain-containing protein n=1 Tax=Cyprinus carpio TaxID=7962 RepID=A0A8C2AVY1_CYPCA